MLGKEKSIIVISTTISICLMLLTGIDNNQEKKVINKNANDKNQIQMVKEVPKTENTNNTIKDIPEVIAKNTTENKGNDVTVKKVEKPKEVKPVEKEKVEIPKGTESSTEKLPEENLQKDEVTEKAVSVFKVKKEDIFNNLSFFDKEKLLLISTKLKAADYKKINALLEGDVDGQGILSSLIILKDKLSKSDFLKIKQIFSKFINMDLIDN